MGKLAFATVGTTRFDALTAALVRPDVTATLAAAGYTRLRIQIGRGDEPTLAGPPTLAVEWYRFKESLAADVRDASLVISHAGAGSILEALRSDGTLLVVVINDALMDNHQEELARELDARRHLVATTVGGLGEALCDLPERAAALVPLPPAKPAVFAHALGERLFDLP